MAALHNRWKCPFCNRPLLPDQLVVDGYVQSVLASPRSEGIVEIRIDPATAEWEPWANAINNDDDSDDQDDATSQVETKSDTR
jgi:hypothetical protein